MTRDGQVISRIRRTSCKQKQREVITRQGKRKTSHPAYRGAGSMRRRNARARDRGRNRVERSPRRREGSRGGRTMGWVEERRGALKSQNPDRAGEQNETAAGWRKRRPGIKSTWTAKGMWQRARLFLRWLLEERSLKITINLR